MNYGINELFGIPPVSVTVTLTNSLDLVGQFSLQVSSAILSVSRVHLGHTNRNVSVSHESQREIALV